MATRSMAFNTNGLTMAEFDNLVALSLSYEDTVDGVPNTETKTAHNRRIVGLFLRNNVKAYLDKQAVDTALAENIIPAIT